MDICSDSAILLFSLFVPVSRKGSALKRKNLLLSEQILSLKSGPRLKSFFLQIREQELMLLTYMLSEVGKSYGSWLPAGQNLRLGEYANH